MAKQSLVKVYEEVSTWQWAKGTSSYEPLVGLMFRLTCDPYTLLVCIASF